MGCRYSILPLVRTSDHALETAVFLAQPVKPGKCSSAPLRRRYPRLSSLRLGNGASDCIFALLEQHREMPSMITASEALERLKEGNRRFIASLGSNAPLGRGSPIQLAPDNNRPFAIILGCSDARVPAEIVFDQGLGDLFVIRVAGNIVAPSQVGSVEFAASRFDTRL